MSETTLALTRAIILSVNEGNSFVRHIPLTVMDAFIAPLITTELLLRRS